MQKPDAPQYPLFWEVCIGIRIEVAIGKIKYGMQPAFPWNCGGKEMSSTLQGWPPAANAVNPRLLIKQAGLKRGGSLRRQQTTHSPGFDVELRQSIAASAEKKNSTSPSSKPNETSSLSDQVKVSEKSFEYTVKKGDTLWDLAIKKFHVNLQNLIKDNNIKNPDRIYPGQKIMINLPEIPSSQEVTASWYGEDYHGRPMANGEPFDMNAATIAHKEVPLGTRVELENPETGQKVKAVVTDRGPFVNGRDVDLSYGLARRLSLVRQGVGKLIMRVI